MLVVVVGYCKNHVISGNKVLDVRGTAGTHGVFADMVQIATISGNTVKDTNRSGIYVFGGKYVTVTGNAVRLENGAALGYEGIRLGTGRLADRIASTSRAVGSYALNNSLIRNNNISTNAVHSGNTATKHPRHPRRNHVHSWVMAVLRRDSLTHLL